MRGFIIISTLVGVAGAVYNLVPFETALSLFGKVRGGVESNPAPVVVALGTFLVTVAYHKARGKTLRESVEVAATRVTFIGESDSNVLKRAQARATRTQLLADQIALENKLRTLPKEIVGAEKDVSYCENTVADLELKLEVAIANQTAAEERLAGLRNAKAVGDAELKAITGEVQKLATAV